MIIFTIEVDVYNICGHLRWKPGYLPTIACLQHWAKEGQMSR